MPKVLQFLADMNADGYQLRGQTPVRGIGVIQGLRCTLHPFVTNPAWKEISGLPAAEQAKIMEDQDFRAQMLAAHTGEHDPNLVGGNFIDRYAGMFELSDPPDYEPSAGESIANRAAAMGCTPEELCYDIVISGGGSGMIDTPIINFADGTLDGVRTMLTHPNTIPACRTAGPTSALFVMPAFRRFSCSTRPETGSR